MARTSQLRGHNRSTRGRLRVYIRCVDIARYFALLCMHVLRHRPIYVLGIGLGNKGIKSVRPDNVMPPVERRSSGTDELLMVRVAKSLRRQR